jgi:hypothetical protein
VANPWRAVDQLRARLGSGTELLSTPAASVFPGSRLRQRGGAGLVDDVQRDYERMKAAGAEFKMPPTKVTGSTIAQANDNCGNLIQITQLNR